MDVNGSLTELCDEGDCCMNLGTNSGACGDNNDFFSSELSAFNEDTDPTYEIHFNVLTIGKGYS